MKEKYGRYTYEYVKSFIEKDGNMLLSTSYKSCKEKLTILCECGQEYITDFDTYVNKNKNKCNLCKKGTTNLIEVVLKNIDSNNATLITNINDIFTYSKIHIKCKCGNDILTTTNYIKNKVNILCKECLKGYQLKSNLDFLNEVKSKVEDEYTFLEEYKGAHIKIKVIHNECGNEYKVTPDKFLNGNRRCPICKKSKGEGIILKYLKNNNINYEPQYTFEDCIYDRKLPFDFAIFDKNKNLKYLIEYDGEFHYINSRVYNTKFLTIESFELTKLRDNIKTEYCKNNNINLIRIPYTEFENIEEILKKSLII